MYQCRVSNSSKTSLQGGMRRNHSSAILLGGPMVVSVAPRRVSDPDHLGLGYLSYEVMARLLFCLQQVCSAQE